MKLRILSVLLFLLSFFIHIPLYAADVVPTEIQMPGTQPLEVGNLESPNKCDNCHAGYNDDTTIAAGEGHPQDEPSTGWRGGAMGNAGRDPIFWATMAIAEQDFDGAGDLCIRCHSTGGWYGGRSTPTDASGLASSDSDGVDCDTCHAMTNPDNSEHIGVMNSPFIANCSTDPLVPDKQCDSVDEGFYGSGMTSLWGGSDKLGPYSDADARHQFMQSNFHRDVDFCGTCHDVSNSAVGDLAPGNGAQPGAPAVISSQTFNDGAPVLGGPVEQKAAFNNPPYAYGVVERTFSEYKASAFPTTRVSAFTSLPIDLQTPGGSMDVTYQAALAAGQGGDYADGTPRYFSCQSCHMRPTTSAGANKRGVQIRTDMPQHDHTGGNYWLADIITYQDSLDMLRLGGGLNETQVTAIGYGQQRAVEHLTQAAVLDVSVDSLKVVNLTGHKLISGYPEGRRMWLNIKWYDTSNVLIREDGAYGPLVDVNNAPVMISNPAGGADVQVESILNLEDPNMRLYDAHYALTKEWADTLLSTGVPANLALSYDYYTGEVDYTLGQLAAQSAGSYHESFHFALNNTVVKDNRIPPYGFNYDIAKKRNALPVPSSQYGGGTAGSTYNYWDQIDLGTLKPAGAVSASITLYYQGTSWEYIQFLYKANNGQNAFLGQEGVNMLDAWINADIPVAIEVAGDRKMVPPVVMATAQWGTPPTGNVPPVAVGDSYTITQDTTLTVAAPGVLGNDSDVNGDTLTAQLIPNGTNGNVSLNTDGSFSYTPSTGFTGDDDFNYQVSDGLALSGLAAVVITVTPTGGGSIAGVDNMLTGIFTGKGGNQVFNAQGVFARGDSVTVRSIVTDSSGNPLPDATVNLAIAGPENITLVSESSDVNGIADTSWNTKAPKRNGSGGTASGSYTATVTGVTVSGSSWNNVETSTGFSLQ